MIDTSGYDRAFLFFGLLQGGIVCAASWSLLAPSTQLMTATVKPNQTTHGYTPAVGSHFQGALYTRPFHTFRWPRGASRTFSKNSS